jgi:hypothetical protein
MLKIINGEDDKVINYINYHNDPDVKITRARNVDRIYENELCKITGL